MDTLERQVKVELTVDIARRRKAAERMDGWNQDDLDDALGDVIPDVQRKLLDSVRMTDSAEFGHIVMEALIDYAAA